MVLEGLIAKATNYDHYPAPPRLSRISTDSPLFSSLHVPLVGFTTSAGCVAAGAAATRSMRTHSRVVQTA